MTNKQVVEIKDGKNNIELCNINVGMESDYTLESALNDLGRNGYDVLSSEELARIRRQEGIKSPFCLMGTVVGENFVYQPKDSNIILVIDREQSKKHSLYSIQPDEKTKLTYIDASKLLNIAESDVEKAIKSGVLALKKDEIVKRG